MREQLRALEDNVLREIEHQAALQELLEREVAALTGGGRERLAEVLRAIEVAVDESRRLETERGRLVAKLAAGYGVDPHHLSLRWLADEAGEPSLAERGEELRQVIERVRDAHHKTTLLVRHSLRFVQDLVGALGGESPEAPATYDARGRSEATRGAALAAEG